MLTALNLRNSGAGVNGVEPEKNSSLNGVEPDK